MRGLDRSEGLSPFQMVAEGCVPPWSQESLRRSDLEMKANQIDAIEFRTCQDFQGVHEKDPIHQKFIIGPSSAKDREIGKSEHNIVSNEELAKSNKPALGREIWNVAAVIKNRVTDPRLKLQVTQENRQRSQTSLRRYRESRRI